MFNSQIQKERSPTVAMNSFVGPTPNFGYVASPVANYSTPAMPRKSRRSFTPLARDMSSPTISPINQPSIKAPAGSASPWNGSLSAIFDNKCSVKVDNAFGKKPISIETPRNLMVERLPSYFSPARNSPQVLSSVYDFKGSNRKPANLSAIKKSPNLVTPDGNLDRSLTKHAMFLTPKTTRQFSRMAKEVSPFENLFDTSPPEIMSHSSIISISSPMLKSNKSPAMFSHSDYNVLNENISIISVLTAIGMSKYIEKFLAEEIDLVAFSVLNRVDLNKLNIAEGDQKTMLEAIDVYADMFNGSAGSA